ncbi:hypothetical protein NHQ30_008585 [Ciborinia camelliae]|nr:hypothetical protein NHQ30_008585 [Ciborinia camelliae]
MASQSVPKNTLRGSNMDRDRGGTNEGGEVVDVMNETKASEIEDGDNKDTMGIDHPEASPGESTLPVEELEEEVHFYGASPLRAGLPNLSITPIIASTNSINTQSAAQQTPQAKTFHRFRDFPAEVRCMVWKYHAEEEEDFGKPRTLTIIAKYNGKNPKNDKRCIYAAELEHRMALTMDTRTRSFGKKSVFPWVAQPAPSYKMPASLYVNRESKDIGKEMYSKSHFLMSIFGNEKPIYFREDLDVLHFTDWFTFNTFCLQYAFVQTKKTSITAALQAKRRDQFPVDEEDLPLHLRCGICAYNNRGWDHQDPCIRCQDLNPRETLDDYVKHLAIGTESFGLTERINAERYATKQTERMQKLRKRALMYINWSSYRLETLVLGMDSHLVSDRLHRGRRKWVEDRYQFKKDVMKYMSRKLYAEIEVVPKKEFAERFGDWDPQLELGW